MTGGIPPPASRAQMRGLDSDFGSVAQSSSILHTFPFLTYACCSMCHSPFMTGNKFAAHFWITSCGHVLCANHEHQQGVCTHCRRHDVQIQPLKPGQTNTAFLYRFQMAGRFTASVTSSLEALEFQNKQLLGLVRYQRQKIGEMQQNEAETMKVLAEAKASDENLQSLNKDLSRQLNEMRIQNEALLSQNANQQARIQSLSTKLLPGQRLGPGMARPPSVMGPPKRGGFTTAYDLHKSREDVEDSSFGGDGGPPLKRPREMMGSNGYPSFDQQEHMEYPPRPTTTVHSMPNRSSRHEHGIIGRPHSVNSFGQGRDPSGQNGPRQNLEQYRLRLNGQPSGPMSLQPPVSSKPSFTLARPSNGPSGFGSSGRRTFVPPAPRDYNQNMNMGLIEEEEEGL